MKNSNLELLRFLAHYPIASIETLENILLAACGKRRSDYDALKDAKYSIRYLAGKRYIQARGDGYYGLLKNGRELLPDIKPFYAVSGQASTRKRIAEVAGVASLLYTCGVDCFAAEIGTHRFIPSTIWRAIRPGILSTSRFAGVLCIPGGNFAMYDIKDGDVEWQMTSELSLFNKKYIDKQHDRGLDGMILLTDGDPSEVAVKILRDTRHAGKDALTRRPQEHDLIRRRYSKQPVRVREIFGQAPVCRKGELAPLITYLNYNIQYPGFFHAPDSKPNPNKTPFSWDFEHLDYQCHINIQNDALLAVELRNLIDMIAARDLEWRLSYGYPDAPDKIALALRKSHAQAYRDVFKDIAFMEVGDESYLKGGEYCGRDS